MTWRMAMCLFVTIGVCAGGASAADVYRPIRAVYIAHVVQAPRAPVRIVVAFDIDPAASLRQHLFVSFKIWDAHGGVVYYAGATSSALRAHHGQITLRWNGRGFDRSPVARGQRYVIRPFIDAYPIDNNRAGASWQFVGGRLTRFVLH